MIFGISHVDIPVRDLSRAESIYSGALGFPVAKRGEGWLDVDTGSCLLRLVHSERSERPATIRVQAGSVEEVTRKLASAGLKVLYEPMRTPALELLSVLADDDGNNVTVWRALSEDEYGFEPDIPKVMTWDEDADALLRSLLKAVPALFRGLARRKVSKNAEYLAEQRGLSRVDKDIVVRSYIMSNAKVTRQRVVQPLLDHGYDPADFPEEFDA